MSVDQIPIVIDNGSWQCRAGWASEDKPALLFKNLSPKNRGKKETEVSSGASNTDNPELVQWALKSQFDSNVVTQFDNQEVVLDHIFCHLGITSSGSVEHPIVMTEPLLNPSYSRQMMTELLFECYQVPCLTYGVDALFSFKKNCPNAQNGLIVSCGHECCQVIPVLEGHVDFASSQRLNVGGFHMVAFLQRLLQLKHQVHVSHITLNRTEEFVHCYCYCPANYSEELSRWESSKYQSKNTHKIQLPFNLNSNLNKTFNKMERCQEMISQLNGVHYKRRTFKLSLDEERLNKLKMIEEMFAESDQDIFQRALHEFGYSSLKDLQEGILTLKRHVQRSKVMVNSGKTYSSSDDLELSRFPDAQSWIEAVYRKRKALQDYSLNKLNREIGIFKSGETEISHLLLNEFEEIDELAEQEHILELDDIVREYQAQFNKEDPMSLAEYHQLHLGTERIRVPEVIFEPSILGLDQSGLSETLENVLKNYQTETKLKLVENVLLTGGCFNIEGIKSRISSDLRQILPFQSRFNVIQAGCPLLDGWNGGREWTQDVNNSKLLTTRTDYDEYGVEYFKEHSLSNPFQSLKTLIHP